MLNDVKLSRICRHFGFAMATGGRKPATCTKMLIFSHLVNFGRNFPSSLLRWQNGEGTAWPGREPEVKRPEITEGRRSGLSASSLVIQVFLAAIWLRYFLKRRSRAPSCALTAAVTLGFSFFPLLRHQCLAGRSNICHLKVAPAQCAARRTVMQKWRRSPDRDLFMQKRSPNQPVYIDMAQERSQVF